MYRIEPQCALRRQSSKSKSLSTATTLAYRLGSNKSRCIGAESSEATNWQPGGAVLLDASQDDGDARRRPFNGLEAQTF